MNYILDITYITAIFAVLAWVFCKQGASSKFIIAVLAAEIGYVFGYSVLHTGNTPYFVSAIAQLVALLFLSVMQGGGISKIIVMFIYVVMLFCHLAFFAYMPFQARPYLDVLAVLSYMQMGVLLFKPRIESFFYGGRFVNYLTHSPVFGGLFRYWIMLSYDGSKKGGA